MEFPDLGKNCEFEGCNQIDFLPIQCRCTKVFCREHFGIHCLSGECPVAPKPKDVNFKNEDEIFKCSQKGCKMGSLHKLACMKCSKHYCIAHRFHPSCPEDREETWAAKLEEYEAPRLLHKEADKISQQKITENIRKALQSSAKVKTAVKIQLMRIKQKAIGDKTQPATKRLYFAIKKPENSEAKPVKILTEEDELLKIESITIDPDLKDSIAIYINSEWSLGRALDCICDLCKIKNVNNTPGSTKVKLFRSFDGYCISPVKNDVLISELIDKQVLQEGDKLTVEYVDTEMLKSLDENAQLFLEVMEK